jgi:hypothetical protein
MKKIRKWKQEDRKTGKSNSDSFAEDRRRMEPPRNATEERARVLDKKRKLTSWQQ